MQAGRAGRDRQPRAKSRSRRQGAVPAFFRRKYDVAEFRADQRLAFDQEFLLAFHDQPELGEILMEMAETGGGRGGHALRADDVGPGVIVLYRAAALAAG